MKALLGVIVSLPVLLVSVSRLLDGGSGYLTGFGL